MVPLLELPGQVAPVAGGEPSGILHGGGKAVPADGGGDRVVERGFGRTRVDQRATGRRQRPHGPADEPAVQRQRFRLATLGAPEHAADELVVEVEGVVGEAWRELEDGRDEDGPPPQGGETLEVAQGQALALGREPGEAMAGDAAGTFGLDADRSQVVEPRHDPLVARSTRCPGRAAQPAEPAQAPVRPRLAQGLQPPYLLARQVAGEAFGDRAIAVGHRGGAQALERRDRRDDDAPAAQLVAQAGGELEAAGRLDGGKIEPRLNLAARDTLKRPEAERPLQDGGVLVLGGLPDGVAAQRAGPDAKLLGDEGDGGRRDDLGRAQQPARVAQGA